MFLLIISFLTSATVLLFLGVKYIRLNLILIYLRDILILFVLMLLNFTSVIYNLYRKTYLNFLINYVVKANNFPKTRITRLKIQKADTTIIFLLEWVIIKLFFWIWKIEFHEILSGNYFLRFLVYRAYCSYGNSYYSTILLCFFRYILFNPFLYFFAAAYNKILYKQCSN